MMISVTPATAATATMVDGDDDSVEFCSADIEEATVGSDGGSGGGGIGGGGNGGGGGGGIGGSGGGGGS